MIKLKYNRLQEIVDQLKKCKYQSKDTLHELETNSAFLALVERAKEEEEEYDGEIFKITSDMVQLWKEADRLDDLLVELIRKDFSTAKICIKLRKRSDRKIKKFWSYFDRLYRLSVKNYEMKYDKDENVVIVKKRIEK